MLLSLALLSLFGSNISFSILNIDRYLTPTMVNSKSKEFSLETQENRCEFLQDFDYDDDGEETLSFCDLPLHSKSSSDWDDNISKLEDFQSSSFDDHDNFFEFISEDFSISDPKLDNIIFCGKLIPYKGPADQKVQKTKNLEITNTTKKNHILFPWKSHSSNKSKQQQRQQKKNAKKSYKTCKSLPPLRVQEERKGYAAAAATTRINNSVTKKNDASMKRVSILGSSTASANTRKSRWHLFAFGVGRLIPRQMELSDMKTRQSKLRSPMKMFPSVDGIDHEMVNSSRNRAKDLWGLLGITVSVLGCINPQF